MSFALDVQVGREPGRPGAMVVPIALPAINSVRQGSQGRSRKSMRSFKPGELHHAARACRDSQRVWLTGSTRRKVYNIVYLIYRAKNSKANFRQTTKSSSLSISPRTDGSRSAL